jgi:hypothetical protein
MGINFHTASEIISLLLHCVITDTELYDLGQQIEVTIELFCTENTKCTSMVRWSQL